MAFGDALYGLQSVFVEVQRLLGVWRFIAVAGAIEQLSGDEHHEVTFAEAGFHGLFGLGDFLILAD